VIKQDKKFRDLIFVVTEEKFCPIYNVGEELKIEGKEGNKMATSFEEVATVLRIKKENLVEEGLKAFLREKLRGLNAEITTIYLKYGVSSFEELDAKINKGELNETDTFDDFTRVDYLEGMKDKLREIMERSR